MRSMFNAASVIAFPNPDEDAAIGCALEIEFGIDANFLPQPDLPDSPRMIESNIKSLLKLVHDLDDALAGGNAPAMVGIGRELRREAASGAYRGRRVGSARGRCGTAGTFLEQILHCLGQHFGHERLLQKRHLLLQRTRKVLDKERRSATDQNTKVRPYFEHAGEQRVARHVGHAEIGDHHAVAIGRGFKISQRIERLQVSLHFKSEPLEIFLDQLQERRFILHQQNLDGRSRSPRHR